MLDRKPEGDGDSGGEENDDDDEKEAVGKIRKGLDCCTALLAAGPSSSAHAVAGDAGEEPASSGSDGKGDRCCERTAGESVKAGNEEGKKAAAAGEQGRDAGDSSGQTALSTALSVSAYQGSSPTARASMPGSRQRRRSRRGGSDDVCCGEREGLMRESVSQTWQLWGDGTTAWKASAEP